MACDHAHLLWTVSCCPDEFSILGDLKPEQPDYLTRYFPERGWQIGGIFNEEAEYAALATKR
jgi:hypothetical protein